MGKNRSEAMKLTKKVSSGALMVLFALALVTPVEAETKTGQYNGNGTTTQVSLNGQLNGIKSLTIVSVAPRGPSPFAYTTNAIQAALGQGTFLNGTKKDTGVAIEVASFTVTNEDFNEEGVTYHWEANGD
jgi:hypothetical protein